MIKYVSALILIFISGFVSAQNHLANPGFEDLNICSEYNSPCAPEAWFYINPVNIPVINTATPPRFTGTNCLWVPIQNVYTQKAIQQIIYTNLLCPLIKGIKYKISFYINTLGRSFYKMEMGMAEKNPGSNNFSGKDFSVVLSVTPNMVIAQIKNWQAVEIIYTAKGGERFFIIGNISNELFPFKEKERMNKAGDVYYFIDDISIRPLNNLPLCAGAERVKSSMYAKNFRHSDSVYIDSSDIEAMIRNDTIAISSIFFKKGKSDFESTFQIYFDSLISKWKTDKIDRIEIEGHTDTTGTFLKNMELSELRAKKIKLYIIRKLPDLKDKIYASGKAWNYPAADNITESGKAQNRRVSIIITYRL